MRRIGHVSVGTLYINCVRMTVTMVGHFDSLLEMAEAINAGQPFRARIWTPKS